MKLTPAISIDEIDVLSEEECSAVRCVVHELRKYWERESGDDTFLRLGARVKYQQVSGSERFRYYSTAMQLNKILQDRLSWLYDRVSAAMQGYLGAPVQYRQDLAVPGFSIFLGHNLDPRLNPDLKAVNHIHYEEPFRLVPWHPEESADFSRPISFTLPIALPRDGAGLDYWNVDRDRWLEMSESDREDVKLGKFEYFPYTRGRVVIHSGLFLHRISIMSNIQPEDERMTLQGHGISFDGSWVLYR